DVDGLVGDIDPVELRGVGVNVHEVLARYGDVEQGVALAGRFREAPAHHQHEVAVAHELQELRVAAQPDVTDEAGVIDREQHLAAELYGHGQLPGLGESLVLFHRFLAPAAATKNGHRLT